MDKTTEKLVDYTVSFNLSRQMTESAVSATKDRLFDSIACAVVGSRTEPARITAKVASTIHSDQPATVFGYGVRTSPEMAALANTGMIRTFDYNDGHDGGGGHASDMIAGCLAAGEAEHSSGIEVLGAIALAYELAGGLGIEGAANRFGFDQGTFQNVAVALAVGKLWGLTPDQLGNAASLALIPNIPLSVSRWGDLSMMKGSATSFSTRNGVFAAMLTREGFTSAPEPFEGIYGFHHLSGPFEVHLPMLPDKLSIEGSKTKYWPAEGNVQGLLDMVPRILEWTTVHDIEVIEVTVPEHLVVHLADEPKYDPQTRETADHSLPYMLMVALQDGTLTVDSYNAERYLDPDLRPLLRKVTVHGSKEYDDLFRAPSFLRDGYGPPRPAFIKIRKTDGSIFQEEVMHHKGHPTNPMTRNDFNAKLDLCSAELTAEQRERIREAWWSVDSSTDICYEIETMKGFRSL